MRMMILEQLDEHRMLKHKDCDVLIVLALRKKTIIAVLDAQYQVIDNTSQHNERWQERTVR